MDRSPQEKAQDILQTTHHVEVVGPRESKLRTLFKFGLIIGVSFAVGKGLSVGIISTLDHLGVVDEMVASRIGGLPTEVMPEYVHWVKLPTSVFVEAGRDAAGVIDVSLLLRRWKQAGLTPSQSAEVAQLILPLSPTLMGRADPNLEQHYLDEAHQAIAQLDSRFPEAKKQLLLQQDPHWVGWNLESDFEDIDPLESAAWPFFQKYKDLSWYPKEKQIPHDVSWEEASSIAKKRLENAVSQTGLRALRLPLWETDDPDRMFLTALQLERANQELRDVTHWQGQVLGLSGRIELILGKPLKEKETAGLTTFNYKGRIQMNSSWNTLGHEWIHALDKTLAGEVLLHPSGRALSEDMVLARRTKNKTIYNAWKNTRDQLIEQAPVWTQARQDAPLVSYFTSPTEMMAFSFNAMIAKNHKVKLLRSNFKNEIKDEFMPIYLLNEQEAKNHQKIWNDAFQHLQSLKLSQSSALKAKTNIHYPTMNQEAREKFFNKSVF